MSSVERIATPDTAGEAVRWLLRWALLAPSERQAGSKLERARAVYRENESIAPLDLILPVAA